jgi:hypothetical protein
VSVVQGAARHLQRIKQGRLIGAEGWNAEASSCDFAQDERPSLAAASRTQVSCFISGLEYCTPGKAPKVKASPCNIQDLK